MPLGRLIGLYGLLVLVPFIIMYLRRPKPVRKIIPSLMFILREKKMHKEYSFLRNLLRNLLFLIQLLVLIGLALSLADPFLNIKYNTKAKNTVLVIDASASSQTKDGLTTRFEKSIDEAKKYVSGRTSIILAENTPNIVLEEGSEKEALAKLATIEAKDTTTSIANAMYAATDILNGREGSVIVFSDFMKTEDEDNPLVVKRLLNSKDIYVKFVSAASKAKNLGIVDLEVGKSNSGVSVKNFNEEPEKANAQLIQNNKVVDQAEITIEPMSIETLNFQTLSGASEIRIANEDDLPLDNAAYIYAPEKRKAKVLFITNKKGSYLRSALEASPSIELEVAEPPIIPRMTHDIIIINEVKKEAILAGTFEEIALKAANGTSFIYTAQDDLNTIDIKNLAIVNLKNLANNTNVNVNIINEFTKDIKVEKAMRYFSATPKEGVNVIATANDNSPLIALKGIGAGNVVYYGIFDKYSDFKTTPDYPIFWNSLIASLIKTEDISDYNFKLADRPLSDKQGIFDEGNKKIAINLLNEKESDVDISNENKIVTEDIEKTKGEDVKQLTPIHFEIALLIVAFILLSLEMAYIKMRGDL